MVVAESYIGSRRQVTVVTMHGHVVEQEGRFLKETVVVLARFFLSTSPWRPVRIIGSGHPTSRATVVCTVHLVHQDYFSSLDDLLLTGTWLLLSIETIVLDAEETSVAISWRFVILIWLAIIAIDGLLGLNSLQEFFLLELTLRTLCFVLVALRWDKLHRHSEFILRGISILLTHIVGMLITEMFGFYI